MTIGRIWARYGEEFTARTLADGRPEVFVPRLALWIMEKAIDTRPPSISAWARHIDDSDCPFPAEPPGSTHADNGRPEHHYRLHHTDDRFHFIYLHRNRAVIDIDGPAALLDIALAYLTGMRATIDRRHRAPGCSHEPAIGAPAPGAFDAKIDLTFRASEIYARVIAPRRRVIAPDPAAMPSLVVGGDAELLQARLEYCERGAIEARDLAVEAMETGQRDRVADLDARAWGLLVEALRYRYSLDQI